MNDSARARSDCPTVIVTVAAFACNGNSGNAELFKRSVLAHRKGFQFDCVGYCFSQRATIGGRTSRRGDSGPIPGCLTTTTTAVVVGVFVVISVGVCGR